MNKFTRYWLLFLLLAVSNICYSQESMESRLRRSVADMPEELIYIQTSKDVYETEEDLWFKVYQFDAQSFGLSAQSRTLYLQMVSSKDSVVWQEKYPIENGIVSGHVYVAEDLADGDYFLEAYTRFSFHDIDTMGILQRRKIRIVKNIAQFRDMQTQKDSAFRFTMFAEGGNLISGLASRLAFKATDGRGNPVSVKGTIRRDGEEVCSIESVHDGMGAILFTPEVGRNYRVVLDNGKSYTLPEVMTQGVGLHLLKQDKDKIEFTVSKSDGLPEQKFYLVGQMRGMLGCVAQGVVKNKQVKVSIPLDNFLYQGIAEFTLLDATMQPIAERLVYLHSQKRLYVSAEPDKEYYRTRDKVTVKIKVTDESGNPVRANLGVSVYDKAYRNSGGVGNMPSYCYLTSQIRGRIHNPAFYFDQENKNSDEAMDLLLLTQGWRRYVWSGNQSANHGQPFLTDEIQGVQTLNNKKKSRSYQGSEQLIQISGAEGSSQFVWADSTGAFVVDPEMMRELRGSYLYLKPMLADEFKPKLTMQDYFPKIDSIRRWRQDWYPTFSSVQKDVPTRSPIIGADSTILINDVVVTGRWRKPFRDKFIGRLDSLAQMGLDVWVCGSCGVLLNYKPDYDGHHSVNICPAESRSRPIDGHTYRIAKYEHFEPKGGGVPFRVIDKQDIVYRASHYTEEELLRRNNLSRTKGYYAKREFYQPDEIDIQTSTPDARNTLLWAPSVITDEIGEAIVSFYCSDINTKFATVVEGADGTGLLGTAKCEFGVIKRLK